MRFFRWFRVWREVPAAIAAGFREVLDSLARTRDLVTFRPPVPLVVALVVCGTRDGAPVVLSQMKTLERDDATLELQAMFPLDKLTVCVVCDVSRVDMCGIFLGTDLLGGLGSSFPVATTDREWLPGVMIRALVRRRG